MAQWCQLSVACEYDNELPQDIVKAIELLSEQYPRLFIDVIEGDPSNIKGVDLNIKSIDWVINLINTNQQIDSITIDMRDKDYLTQINELRPKVVEEREYFVKVDLYKAKKYFIPS